MKRHEIELSTLDGKRARVTWEDGDGSKGCKVSVGTAGDVIEAGGFARVIWTFAPIEGEPFPSLGPALMRAANEIVGRSVDTDEE